MRVSVIVLKTNTPENRMGIGLQGDMKNRDGHAGPLGTGGTIAVRAGEREARIGKAKFKSQRRGYLPHPSPCDTRKEWDIVYCLPNTDRVQ